MKQHRDAAALAASLQTAANTPLPLPTNNQEREAASASEPPVASSSRRSATTQTRADDKRAKNEAALDTVGMTIRPRRQVHNRYVLAAAERTRKVGRVVSAQEIMLEVLEAGLASL